MTYKTHIVGGILLTEGVGLAAGLPVQQLLPAIAVGSVSALLPDLDIPRSKASRYGLNRLVAYPLNKLFGHRGFIHSPVLCAALTLLLAVLHCPIWAWAGFGLGFLSHLVLDSLNPSGIPWLWPCKKRFHLLSIKTNSVGEKGIWAALATSALILLIRLF